MQTRDMNMSEAICRGCGGVMDTTGIEPFTECECSDCGTEILIPFQLDYLLLEKPIGRKSFIDIYEGFDKSSNSASLIMVLDNEISNYESFLKLAIEEANELSSILKNPHIAPVISSDEILGNFCIVSPLIDGYSLSDYSPKDQGLLDVEAVMDVVQAAALGMAVAHNKGFVHHNVSPENIQIDARGNVRVTNFFLSRFTYAADQKTNKASQVIKCDPSVSSYFISPEKAESGVEDQRGDVFSFGVTMYYMLTGKYPFAGKNEVETVYSRVKTKPKKEENIYNSASTRMITPDTVEYVPPKHPKEIRPEIPDAIDSLIMDMLSYLPVKRPKFTEILTIFNLLMAEQNKQETVVAAQRTMVTTATRAIPKMGNLGKKKKKS